MKNGKRQAMAARHSVLPAAAARTAGLQSLQLPASQSAAQPSSGIHPASSSQPAYTVPSEYALQPFPESQQVNKIKRAVADLSVFQMALSQDMMFHHKQITLASTLL